MHTLEEQVINFLLKILNRTRLFAIIVFYSLNISCDIDLYIMNDNTHTDTEIQGIANALLRANNKHNGTDYKYDRYDPQKYRVFTNFQKQQAQELAKYKAQHYDPTHSLLLASEDSPRKRGNSDKQHIKNIVKQQEKELKFWKKQQEKERKISNKKTKPLRQIRNRFSWRTQVSVPSNGSGLEIV